MEDVIKLSISNITALMAEIMIIVAVVATIQEVRIKRKQKNKMAGNTANKKRNVIFYV